MSLTEPARPSPRDAAFQALTAGRADIAEKLRAKRADRDRINREIKALVAEDEGLQSALRPFERAAKKAANGRDVQPVNLDDDD